MEKNGVPAKSVLLFLVIIFFSFLAHGEPWAKEELGKFDLVQDGKSIYNINYWTDPGIIMAGLAISVIPNAFAYSIINQSCPCDPNGLNFIDRPVAANQSKTADIMANYTVTLAVIAPVVIDYLDIGFSKSFVEDMIVYSEVLSVNFGLVTIAKFAVQRPYPYVYQKSPSAFQTDPSDYLSFYSGHTTTTVSALTAASITLSLRHKDVLWPWIVTGIMGASVATELVLSAEHFTTDVIVGAAMGLAVGSIIPGLHAKDRHWINDIYFISNTNQAEVMWKKDI